MRDEIEEQPGSHEPTEFVKSPKKAAASGWVGSALEYYDFFIYAQAAALIFPDIFFPEGNEQVAIVASFATFGVGYVARPLGAFVLGHWGDKHGRKNMLVLCMLAIGISTMLVAFLPTYSAIGVWAPILLVALRLIQGFAVGGEISGASAMILEHAPFGRRGYYTSFSLQGVQAGQLIAAAVFLPLSIVLPEEAFESWGWRIPFLLSAVVVIVIVGMVIRRRVDETPAFQEEAAHGDVPQAPIVEAVRNHGNQMARVVGMALMNTVPITVNTFGATYATNEDYGVNFGTSTYLWISVVGNIVAMALIPYLGQYSDRIGRKPIMIFGCVASGLLAIPYLMAIRADNVPLAFLLGILMWGVFYQGYNAVFPSFYQEQFPTRTRVSAFAVSQNIGTMITAFLPVVFGIIAGPGSNVPIIVGAICLVITLISAVCAWFSPETFRIHLNDLGEENPQEVPLEEYHRLRREAVDA